MLVCLGNPAHADDARLSGTSLGLLDSVRVALQRNPTVLNSSRQVDIARGQLQQAQGAFDSVVSASITNQRSHTVSTAAEQQAAGDAAVDSTVLDQTSSSLKVTQLLRSGVTIEPAITLSRINDGSVAAQSLPTANRSTVGVNVTLPLLKNPGADVAAVGERSAEMELSAVRLDQTQTVAQTTLGVVLAYWSYLAAERARLSAVDAERSGQRRVEDTGRLIEAEMLPAAERDLVTADLAAKRSARIAAEQAVEDARAALSRAMGLSSQEARALPLPGEDFPDTQPPASDPQGQLERMRDLALRQRADLQALQIRYSQAELALDATRRSLKPQLDLTLGVGVSGLSEGNAYSNYFGAANSQLRGPNATVGLSYQFPVQNRGAVGLLVQKQGALDQLDTNRRDLQSAILINAEGYAMSVHRLGLQLTDARKSVELYAKSVENEEVRRKMGRSTLMDVLTVTDRLLQARQTLTTAQLNYAVAIAQLRFACGAFFTGDSLIPEELVLDRASLLTPP